MDPLVNPSEIKFLSAVTAPEILVLGKPGGCEICDHPHGEILSNISLDTKIRWVDTCGG